MLQSQVLPYFSDLLPLVESWQTLLGSYVHKEDLVPFDEVIEVIDDFLTNMPDEKPPEMTIVLHELEEWHHWLKANLAPCLTAKLGANTTNTGSGNTDLGQSLPPKHLHDEVRSMDNPCHPAKRFKVM